MSDTAIDLGRADDPVIARMSTLDRLLPAWILIAMVAGLGLGRLVPSLGVALGGVQLGGVSLPIAVGPAGDDVPGAGQGPL